MNAVAIADDLKALYRHRGPFATAYLDVTRVDESGGKEVLLRWRALRERLQELGAARDTLDAMQAHAADYRHAPGARGKLLVAADGNLLSQRPMRQPPVREAASLAPLPNLMPYFAQSGPSVAFVLVVADRTGADVTTVEGEIAGQRTDGSHRVAGDMPYPIHKSASADWSERRFQLRVENAWAANARKVADAVNQCVEQISAEMVIVAGDVRARGLLREDLAMILHPGVEIAETAAGGRAAGSSSEALEEATQDAVNNWKLRRRREMLERLADNLGRRENAVAGVNEVIAAIRRGQVDTVVISDDPSSTLTAWLGPEPLQLGTSEQELRDMGVANPQRDRFDAVLVRAVAGTDARLMVTPNAHMYVHEGIAALLRFSDAVTTRS